MVRFGAVPLRQPPVMGTAEQSNTSPRSIADSDCALTPRTAPAQPGECRAASFQPHPLELRQTPGSGWDVGFYALGAALQSGIASDPGTSRAVKSGSGGPGTCRDVTAARSLRSPARTPRAPEDLTPDPRQRYARTEPAGPSSSAAALPGSSSSPRPAGVKDPPEQTERNKDLLSSGFPLPRRESQASCYPHTRGAEPGGHWHRAAGSPCRRGRAAPRRRPGSPHPAPQRPAAAQRPPVRGPGSGRCSRFAPHPNGPG